MPWASRHYTPIDTKLANDKAEPIPHVPLDGYVTVSETGALRDLAIKSVSIFINETL
ncbi:MAG: hypothetical protein QHH17_00805 [Candidatus Bathyarchaeota archaeon]|nr:hypothetical protein [Candidatus Bathyarchaeota archaeon]